MPSEESSRIPKNTAIKITTTHSDHSIIPKNIITPKDMAIEITQDDIATDTHGLTPTGVAIEKFGSLLPTKELEDQFVNLQELQEIKKQDGPLNRTIQRIIIPSLRKFLNNLQISEEVYDDIITTALDLQINDDVLLEDVDNKYKGLKTKFEYNLQFMTESFGEHKLVKFKNAYNQLNQSSLMKGFESYKTRRLSSLFCAIISTTNRLPGLQFKDDYKTASREDSIEYTKLLNENVFPYMEFLIKVQPDVVNAKSESLKKTPLEIELSKFESSGRVVKFLIENNAKITKKIKDRSHRVEWVNSVIDATQPEAINTFFCADDVDWWMEGFWGDDAPENAGGRKRRNKKQTRRSKKTKKRRTGRSKK